MRFVLFIILFAILFFVGGTVYFLSQLSGESVSSERSQTNIGPDITEKQKNSFNELIIDNQEIEVPLKDFSAVASAENPLEDRNGQVKKIDAGPNLSASSNKNDEEKLKGLSKGKKADSNKVSQKAAKAPNLYSSNRNILHSNHRPLSLSRSSEIAKHLNARGRSELMEGFLDNDAYEDSFSEDKQKIEFSATFKSKNDLVLKGGWISDQDLSANNLTELSLNAIAVADKNGRCVFNLALSDATTSLFFVYENKSFQIFNLPVNEGNAWKENQITLPIDVVVAGEVSGLVINLKKQPVKGAIVCNRPVRDLDDHQKMLKDTDYRYTVTGANGTYVLTGLAFAEKIKLYCLLSGYPVVSSQEILLTEANPFYNIPFKVAQEVQMPATWSGIVVDDTGRTLRGIKLSLVQHATYAEAINDKQVIETGVKGEFYFMVEDYLKETALYQYDEYLGVVKIKEYVFELSEHLREKYVVQTSNLYTGRLVLRVQDKNGKDINKGWIATSVVTDGADFERVISQGGYGSPLDNLGRGVISQLPSGLDYEFFFCNELGTQVSLGLFKVEDKGVLEKVVRLDENAVLLCSFSGSVVDRDAIPWSGEMVRVTDLAGVELANGVLDENGAFAFQGLSKYSRVKLQMYDQYTKSTYGSTFLLDKDVNAFGVLEINPVLTSFKVELVSTEKNDAGLQKPIQGAVINIEIDGVVKEKLLSDEYGIFYFSNYKRDSILTVSIVHNFFQPIKKELVLGEAGVNAYRFEMNPKKVVIGHLTGYDWSKPVFVKSYVVIKDDQALVSDNTVGNSYAEILADGLIYFLSPPKDEFFIYVGGIVEPYGSGLYGPFKADQQKNQLEIDLPLRTVKPVRFRLNNKVGGWNLNIFAVPANQAFAIEANKETEGPITGADSNAANNTHVLSHPIKSVQLGGEFSPYYYLTPGKYKIHIMDNQGVYKDLIQYLEVKENEEYTFLMEPKELQIPKGGYVKSYIVSDRFDLGISEGNTHHQELCPGFEKDHLGGEAGFQAEHLGVYDSPEKDKKITWTRESSNNGVLSFKKKFPHPASDYAVAYAQYTVVCSEEKKVWLGVSADDGLKVWHNGKLVLYRHRATPLGQLDHKLIGRESEGDPPLILKKGENLFVFKVDNSWGEWALRSRFVDPENTEVLTDLVFKDTNSFTATSPAK